jgi:hypothetical protein
MRALTWLALLAGCGGAAVHDPKAAMAYPDYRTLHEAIITPTCGPRGGVCHNSKQFPDMHTPENLLSVIGQRCNQLTDDPKAIVELCEPAGDLLVITSDPDTNWKARVGYVVADAAPPTTLTVTLHDPVPHDGTDLTFSIVRDIDPKSPLEIPIGNHLTTHAGQRQATITGVQSLPMGQRSFFTAPYTPGLDGQLFLGDPNQNGTFGFDLGGALIKPGAPSKSFFVQRILGIVQPRMPLANGDLTDDEIYALQCWILQMKPDGSNADGPIDYARCPARF